MVGRLYQLDFDTLHAYGTNKDNMEVPVTLRLGQTTVAFRAQLDTGATFCVFERGSALRFVSALDRRRHRVSQGLALAASLEAEALEHRS